VFIGGGTAAPTHTEQVKYKHSFQVRSPEVESYTTSLKSVSGTMPMRDFTVTVVYLRADGDSKTALHLGDLQSALNFDGVVMNVGDCFD
jgi:hypothetical protein